MSTLPTPGSALKLPKRPEWNASGAPGARAIVRTSPTMMTWSPPSWLARTTQSKRHSASARCGGCGLLRQCGSTSNLSCARRAKCSASSSWWCSRMWTAKGAAGTNAGRPLLPFDRHHKSSGGSSDTEVKELAVTPTGSPSGRTPVITVTPVANSPKASRSSRWVGGLLTSSHLGGVRHARCPQLLAIRGRHAAALLGDAVARGHLGGDQRLAAERGQLRIARECVDDAAVELWGLAVTHEILVLVRPVTRGCGGALGQLWPEPQRDGGDVVRPQVDRHVGGKLVQSGLLRTVGRTVHVAAGTERGCEGDQPRTPGDHEWRSVVARHVGRTQADVENLGELERLLPETARLDEVIVNTGGVVHQDVEAARLVGDAGKQFLHRAVVAVVTRHGNATPAERGDRAGRLGHRPRECGVLQSPKARVARAAGDIDRHAGGTECQRDALASAAARAGDDRDLWGRRAHGALCARCWNSGRSPPPCTASSAPLT